VALDKGFFKEAGLEVNIIQPGEVYAEQAVATGAADFGISFQEQMTLLHGQDPANPLVSIAAIIQHNTSGFASLAEAGIDSPAKFEGLTYGSFSGPFEQPTLKALMSCAGADADRLEIVDVGYADPLPLLNQKQIDLAWIFYGTQGTAAQQQGLQLNVVMMSDYTDCIPDYYTPVLIASQKTITERPELVRAFVSAVSQGYQFAIQNPDESASILLKFSPESGEAVLKTSQEWLSQRYQAEAARWGDQKLEVWQNYADWMLQNGIISQPVEASQLFTTEFLP
jgi:ABC-type nitrate/sulfonate/bicarbonate transport system substrate-binding protein